MFIVYSDMFRLTRVIFRLELHLFAMSLCSSQNEHSDIANKSSSSLKMTRVSRNMSLWTINIIDV